MAEGSDQGDEDEGGAPYTTPPRSLPALTLSRPPRTRSRSSRSGRGRRRPFLIFDNIPPRGFKRLKPNPSHKTKQLLAQRRAGDGFSDHEARPNGLVLMAGKRKLPPDGVSAVGALDVTASATSTMPNKREKAARRVEDNSFALCSEAFVRSPRHKRQKTEDQAIQQPQLNRRNDGAPKSSTVAVSAPYGASKSTILGGSTSNDSDSDFDAWASAPYGAAKSTILGEVGLSGKEKDEMGRNTEKLNEDDSEPDDNDSVVQLPSIPSTQPNSSIEPLAPSPAPSWETYVEETSSPGPRGDSAPPVIEFQESVAAPAKPPARLFRRVKTL